ncbi:AbrB/MazE/SpoVT family DNA-binding domain-containing protein [Halodesulfurarchaeum formicicum]|uniref:AbrB family transcriptional regulator n=1 Tax=Halodesulfurarchaeum formicicum TaxID=1873524 RepID=A0A1J1AAZ1_9EURY|nr:AbrB/MazE/SpoVT family DNA-binding domain-containing protein [Halodesulfurarchaeum formicicum]APE95308.1 AbrB family transcriptional regulator [Halodesulfurarchaeum formicicum]
MSDPVCAVSSVLGTKIPIPARIRAALDLEDGDQLRWEVEDEKTVRLTVVPEPDGTVDLD